MGDIWPFTLYNTSNNSAYHFQKEDRNGLKSNADKTKQSYETLSKLADGFSVSTDWHEEIIERNKWERRYL